MQIDVNHLKIRAFAFDLIEVGAWWNFKSHISPFARIFLIMEGHQMVSFHGKTYHHEKGGLALVPPYTPVDYFCDEYCRQYYFVFTCRLPDGKDLFADCSFPYLLHAEPWHAEMCQRLLDDLPNFGLTNVDANSEDFNKMIFSTPKENLTLEQKFATQGVVSLLMSRLAAGARKSGQLIRLSKAFLYIENNLHGDLSLNKLSEIEGMSKTYFSDQFTLHTGIRPSEYIAQKRIAKARELLTTSPLTLPEIGTRIGIFDQSYLCRFFKKHLGISPRKYRMIHTLNDTGDTDITNS